MKELREKRAGLIYEMDDILKKAKENEGGRMTPEQEERWDKLEADEARLMRDIERGEKIEKLSREMAAKDAETKEVKSVKTADEQYAERWIDYIMTGVPNGLEKRTTQDGQSVGTLADGGYTVPQTWASMITDARLAFGGMLDVSTIVNTTSGEQINFPTTNDTATKSSILAEETLQTESKKTFGTKPLNAWVLATSIIPISMQLIQDSAYDIVGHITKLLGENDARGINYYTTVGNGTNQHNGVVTAATTGKTAASATAFTRNELVDLLHSVDPEYRKNGRWMFHDNVLKAIKKLTIGTTDARPLWQPGIVAGEPATIEGYPYTINQDMSSTITASDITVLFGDFKNYHIRLVNGFNLFRFNEKYMNSLQVALMGWSRSDGELINAGTNPIKSLVQASS
jgi:HK97 family phage major capsid protein